jgi:formamidopyrimidine-DNA glycosylase
MPELPEVETIKNDLKPRVVGKKIAAVEVRSEKTVRGSVRAFKLALPGKKFIDISRRGKLLIFKVIGGQFLLIHLKMTGQLIYCGPDGLVAGGHANSEAEEERFGADQPDSFCRLNKYTRVIFRFSDNSQLFFNDLRRFGYLQIVDKKKLTQVLAGFGSEPLAREFSLSYFSEILTSRRKSIKAVLLDQKLIAGIGNIYADESLFAAGIRPMRPAHTLTAAEKKKLFSAIKNIIKKAIKYRGTTFSNYVDGRGQAGGFRRLLKVYRREGQKCLRCRAGIIKKTTVAGRGTRYCPVCQR